MTLDADTLQQGIQGVKPLTRITVSWHHDEHAYKLKSGVA